VTRNRALLAGALLALVAVAISAWAYPSLAATVPTHWDMAGHINGYSSRGFAVSLMPSIIAFTWLLMLVLPAISPRGFRLESSAGAFYSSVLAIMAALVVLHFIVVRAELGKFAPSNVLTLSTIGVLLAVLGAFMGRLKKNFFIGVRTPWTLASDEVWRRTHELAGRLFVAGGAAIVVASLFSGTTFVTLLAVIAIVALVPIVYSYVLYRRIEGFGSEP
jgi:uncharacterized membrane protein